MVEQLLVSLTVPAELFGHFTYVLLIASMLMRRMEWLRALAIAAGVAKIIYRMFFVPDPVSVFWELIFVAVNAGQLLLIWYYARHHRFDEDERLFLATMPDDVERRAIRRLLRSASIRTLDKDEVLTTETQPVTELMYVVSGVVTVEKNGAVIAACGPGDYIGEMSFLTGDPASATVRVVKPVRLLCFDQRRLRESITSDGAIRRAMEASLNRNLVFKLNRANDVPRAATA